jgi:hypothetical protein
LKKRPGALLPRRQNRATRFTNAGIFIGLYTSVFDAAQQCISSRISHDQS